MLAILVYWFRLFDFIFSISLIYIIIVQIIHRISSYPMQHYLHQLDGLWRNAKLIQNTTLLFGKIFKVLPIPGILWHCILVCSAILFRFSKSISNSDNSCKDSLNHSFWLIISPSLPPPPLFSCSCISLLGTDFT